MENYLNETQQCIVYLFVTLDTVLYIYIYIVIQFSQ